MWESIEIHLERKVAKIPTRIPQETGMAQCPTGRQHKSRSFAVTTFMYVQLSVK